MRSEELWLKPRGRGFFDINRRYPNIIKERDNWDIIGRADHPIRPALLHVNSIRTVNAILLPS